MTSTREHWGRVWATKDPTEVSWFEPTPRTSLAMIEALDLPSDAPILDVGGGASALAGELLGRGYSDITVADISRAALERAAEALGPDAERVEWLEADVRDHDFGRRFELWHDRAVFHFLTEPADRDRYLETLERSVGPGAHLIVATFGPDGPTTCSGLPVARYGGDQLGAVLAPVAELVSSRLEQHLTPSGNSQEFLYAQLRAR